MLLKPEEFQIDLAKDDEKFVKVDRDIVDCVWLD